MLSPQPIHWLVKSVTSGAAKYGEALCIIGEYVNITDSEPEHKNSLRQQLKATKPADPVKKQQTSKQQER